MFFLSVVLLIGGYALTYYGTLNARNGGKGPTFPQVIGTKTELTVEHAPNNAPVNMTGQPATSVDPPSGGVWT